MKKKIANNALALGAVSEGLACEFATIALSDFLPAGSVN